MRRFPTLRHGAALLALLAVAACDNAPTAASDVRTPGQTTARFTLSPPSGLSVTNSGGYPLVSWTAPAGATSYKVSLISYVTVNGAYQRRFIGTLATVTGTSYLDTANPYTGSHNKCDEEGPDGNIYGGWYEYQLIANYPTGSSLDTRIYAPIGEC